MLFYKISDAIVFNALKRIKYGYLEITKIDGEVIKFGNPDENLKVSLQIKDERLMYNLIKNGSVGLGESYMKNFFTTNNLSDLIELSAKNIKIMRKMSGKTSQSLPNSRYFAIIDLNYALYKLLINLYNQKVDKGNYSNIYFYKLSEFRFTVE